MHYYGCYDPLQYPLLFPLGDCGWHPGLKKMSIGGQRQLATCVDPVRSALVHDAESLLLQEEEVAQPKRRKVEKEISCREYYAFLLQIRTSTCLLLACRLLQQFIVDMYVKIENTRLDFLRNNQQTIRADLYQGLLDTLEAGESSAANVGHRVILPPSFIGSPRDMKCRYLNAMALVQKFGKPDLFATMTCNPKWPEIKRELADGEKTENRPDLIARIFRAKLLLAKKKIMQEKIFGEVAAMIYVVEFQKRGLPHAHFLIILKPEFKVKDPSDFDKFVSAEIPSSDNPHLLKAVLSHMMHGPCGKDYPSCPCMRNKGGQFTCKSAYPKAFVEHTSNNNDGYPVYRRQATGEAVLIRGKEMDNRWVIPYNPYLLAFFDCHFNVEICSTIQAVKYLYKYVYKGHDRISFNVVGKDKGRPFDEIEHFQSGRWISPPEAAWRIFAFDLYDMYPSVMPLQVHLNNRQAIQFRPHEMVGSIVGDYLRSRTPLTEFFIMNAREVPEQEYLYSEFPEHYVWDSTSKTWNKRKQREKVGRLTFASPAEGERYYLRILLANVRGPKSFEDIQTVNGYKCATFQEAALKRGLIERADSMEQCLNEAVAVQMPHALRRLFVTLLIFCQPPNPMELWNKYYPALSEDHSYANPHEESKVLQLTSRDIERLLEAMGRTLKEFGLEHLKDILDVDLRMTRDIEDALKLPIPEEYVHARKQLNTKQREAYKRIVACVKANRPGTFFIDGPGGTGKTFLYCALYAKVRLMDKIVLSTATSGIAAANLPGGRTAHSRFKIPIDYNVNLTCNVPKQGSLATLLKKTTLIIWDEASMAHKANIHALDLLLRDLCMSELPFGWKIVVFGGDFRQVLPVVPHKTQREAVVASLVCSELWPAFEKLHLTENMRAKEDPLFADFLLALGDGKLQAMEQDLVPLPKEIIVPFQENYEPVQQLARTVFPEIEPKVFTTQIFSDRAILTPKHEDVDAINSYLIAQFHGESVVYKSFDTLLDDNCNVYPTEFLHTLAPGGMSPHELILKKDCPVILLRNIDPSSGLCNGTRLTCKRFLPNLIICVIAVGYYEGKKIMLPRVNLLPPASSNYPFQFQRKQFPIKLSFAMTINKSQGQTLNQVGIYLRQPCFSRGQLYVALSRARKSSKVRVLSRPIEPDHPQNRVRNLILFEVLKRAGIM